MKRQLSIFLAQSKTFLSSKSLQGSFLALVSGAILSQPVFANNNAETFYFFRNYQESGYRLEGKFTAVDANLDNIISASEVSKFAAFLTDLDDNWQESIDLGAKKNIVDFYYDLDSYLSSSHDLKFQVDTSDPNNNYSYFSAPLKADTVSKFPIDSSWKVDFTEDADFFQITDYIIAGMDRDSTGVVTFIDDGGNVTTTPEASNLGGIALVAIVFFGLRKK